jgi:putative ABC transport system permease protein
VSALAATLRIARRDVRRAKGRSVLVVVMIALPVLGVGAADVLYRTFQLSPEQKATRTMGAADAVLTDTGSATLTQLPGDPGVGVVDTSTGVRVGRAPRPTSVLPAGSALLADREASDGQVTVRDATVAAGLRDVDYLAPLARGQFTTHSGRAPRTGREVALTTTIARRLGVRLGDHVDVGVRSRAPKAVTVVGLVDDASSTTPQIVLMVPGALQLEPTASTRFLVDVPGQLTWSDVTAANTHGFLLAPRTAVPGQPAARTIGTITTSKLTAVALVVGMTLLEIVLLAGPAFAVGAKRQSRELALLSATGGEGRHVRGVVLGHGVVLGVLGGLLGVAAGIGLGRLAQPLLRGYSHQVPGPFDVRPLELIGVAAVGVLTAVLAAVLPARSAARQDVVAALTGRRGQLRSLRRTPVLGLCAAVGGAAIALEGARQRSVDTILAGSAVAELGLVATTPFLVGLVGRIGPWLPVGPRLALRDAARNRGRTAPAVSAVLAAVAGSVAVGTYLASYDQYNRNSYRPSAPYGTAVMPLYGDTGKSGQVEAALRRTLPAATVVVVRTLDQVTPVPGSSAVAPATVEVQVSPVRACSGNPMQDRGNAFCDGTQLQPTVHGVLVGDAGTVAALTGRSGDPYAAVLARGGAVVPRPYVQEDGTAVLAVRRAGDPGGKPVRTVRVPAVALPADVPQVTVVSKQGAARTGLTATPVGVVASSQQPPTAAQEDRARHELDKLDLRSSLVVERGYAGRNGLSLLALLVGSAVIVLGASGIATGLAAAEGRADLATLAAVGASPGRRRSLAAFQSIVTAGLGTLLGTIAGLVPAVGMVRALNAAAATGPFVRINPYPLVLPWRNLAITVLVVPLIAALAAAALTRSRLPMVRRMA